MELNERIMLGIVRISERFKKEASLLFSAVGLTFSQYNVLRILDVAPDGRLAITDVGRRMLVSGANMTGIAKRLERNGLITRQASKTDERIKYLQINSAGRQVLKDVQVIESTRCSNFLSAFSDEEKHKLFGTVVTILKSRSIELW
jgi:DNA-binding MarR family transcriptional regulator